MIQRIKRPEPKIWDYIIVDADPRDTKPDQATWSPSECIKADRGATGPPGTGKTALRARSQQRFKSGDVKKIVLTGHASVTKEDLGYLPGTIENKMDPWTPSMFDILELAKTRIKQMVDNRTWGCSPRLCAGGRSMTASSRMRCRLNPATMAWCPMVAPQKRHQELAGASLTVSVT